MPTPESRLRELNARQLRDAEDERAGAEFLAKRATEDAVMATTLAAMPERKQEPCSAPTEHDWKPVGRCTHGFGGAIGFTAYICSRCGAGGHGRRPGFSCPRRGEGKAEREARIERQVQECPVYGRLSEVGQRALRA